MIAWFRNKQTGQEWEISHPDHIERLNGDPAFERVPNPSSRRLRRMSNSANTGLRASAKLLLGLDPQATTYDDLLDVLLERTQTAIMDYCNVTALDQAGLVNLQLDMTVLEWNRRGMEGEQSHGEGALNRTLVAGLPPEMTDRLNLYRKARW